MFRTMLAILRCRPQLATLTHVRLLIPALAILLALSACGNDEDDTEATAAATLAAATLTPVSIVSSDPPQISPVAGSPGAVAPSGTPATVGELALLVDDAWSSVTSYRATTTNAGSGGLIAEGLASPAVSAPVARIASPVASPDAFMATDEVVMPDLRRQLVREAGAQSEFVAANGLVYTRGAYNRVYINPTLDPAAWVRLDPSSIPSNTPLAIFVERFAGPEAFNSPFANLQSSTREAPLTPFDTSTVDGRTCQSYRVVQTTQTGERVDVTLAIDETNLPCYEETAAGGIVNRTTYNDFNAGIVVETPANAIDPPGFGGSSSPPASPDAP